MFKLVFSLLTLLPLIHPKVYVLNVADIADNGLSIDDPPPHTDYTKMARWLVHNVEW